MSNIPFQVIEWDQIPQVDYAGETGNATWQTLQFAGLRIRIVRYSSDYIADHWCRKGHIVHCLEGGFTSEMESGERFEMKVGMTYVVSDEMSSHRSLSTDGVKLLIIDGDFLQFRSPGNDREHS